MAGNDNIMACVKAWADPRKRIVRFSRELKDLCIIDYLLDHSLALHTVLLNGTVHSLVRVNLSMGERIATNMWSALTSTGIGLV